MGNFLNGSQIRVFTHNGTKWVTLGTFATSANFNYNNEVQTVSSKDHGLHPEVNTTGSSWSVSASMLCSTANANKVLGMAQTGQPYSIAFGSIAESNWQAGLKSVTNVSTNVSFTPSSTLIKYGDAIVSSASISGNDNETATIDVEFTGSGILSSTAPTTPKSYT